MTTGCIRIGETESLLRESASLAKTRPVLNRADKRSRVCEGFQSGSTSRRVCWLAAVRCLIGRVQSLAVFRLLDQNLNSPEKLVAIARQESLTISRPREHAGLPSFRTKTQKVSGRTVSRDGGCAVLPPDTTRHAMDSPPVKMRPSPVLQSWYLRCRVIDVAAPG